MNSLKKAEDKGREAGKIDGKIEIVRKMLAKNNSISDISDITCLSTKKIENLLRTI